jgi:hypothetical protein
VELMAIIGGNELKRKMLITMDKQSCAVIEVTFSSSSAARDVTKSSSRQHANCKSACLPGLPEWSIHSAVLQVAI